MEAKSRKAKKKEVFNISEAFKFVMDFFEEIGITNRQLADAIGIDIRTLQRLADGGGYKREEQLRMVAKSAVRIFEKAMNEAGTDAFDFKAGLWDVLSA